MVKIIGKMHYIRAKGLYLINLIFKKVKWDNIENNVIKSCYILTISAEITVFGVLWE